MSLSYLFRLLDNALTESAISWNGAARNAWAPTPAKSHICIQISLMGGL